MPGEIRTTIFTCHACEARFEIVADDVPPGTEVKCTRCGTVLGVWNELVGHGEVASPGDDARVFRAKAHRQHSLVAESG